MKKAIILTLITLIIGGCSFGKKMIEEDKLYVMKDYIGVFDTCYYHPGKFMRSPSVLIVTNLTHEGVPEKHFVCIYGKKCDFTKGDWLYIRAEYWNTAIRWKYTVVNLEETKKHYLTY